MIDEDIASQSSVVLETRYRASLKRHHFRVHVSPGSAETLVRRGGITNHHSIAYSLTYISAKNYQNRLMCVEDIACNISVVFLRHSVHIKTSLITANIKPTLHVSSIYSTNVWTNDTQTQKSKNQYK